MMKKSTELGLLHRSILALLGLLGIGAATHLVLLLIQSVSDKTLYRLGLVSILDLSDFFPNLHSSAMETTLSFLLYTIVVGIVLWKVRRLSIRISEGSD